MARELDSTALLASWRALSSPADRHGWETIALEAQGSVRMRAGRYFPGNLEALIVQFASVRIPLDEELPKGRGFTVSRVSLETGIGGQWIALRRQTFGSIELFAIVAADLADFLSASQARPEADLLPVFLARIRLWQDFMRRADDGVLSAEAEAGLVGELIILDSLLNAGIPPRICVASWIGPLDGSQDFQLGSGAIEVKSSTSVQGFVARISSLDQLDDSHVTPIYVAAVRLVTGGDGRTLPEIVAEITQSISDADARHLFLARILQAGFNDRVAVRYSRRFTPVSARYFAVTSSFPKLVRHMVPRTILDACYDIALDAVESEPFTLADVLTRLGAQ